MFILAKFYFVMSEFKSVTREICKLPSFFSTALFRRIDTNGSGIVTRYAVLIFTRVIVGSVLISGNFTV